MESRAKGVRSVAVRLTMAVLLGLLCFAVFSGAATPSLVSAAQAMPTDEFQADADAGGGTLIVHPKLGGQILGYDIDRNGTEGLLSEYVSLGNGNNNVATETFDQKTGKILKVVVKKTNTQDDYVTQGIWGSIGLVMFEHELSFLHIKRTFHTIDPLDGNKFTGKWTPPIKKNYQLWTTSVSPEGTADVAAYQVTFDGSFKGDVFSTNIATNTFGPQIPLILGDLPLLGYDSKTNQAVLAHSGTPTEHASVQTVDLTTGKVRTFTALGVDIVNGLAVDSATGTACITTEGGPFTPPMVEFYNLAKQTGFGVVMSGANIGLDVEFDPIHKLFLAAEGDFVNFNVLVFDEKGKLKETISVQKLPVSPSLIALNPGKRIGFLPVIVEPQHEFLELQSFKY
jgi:hypothetical protein